MNGEDEAQPVAFEYPQANSPEWPLCGYVTCQGGAPAETELRWFLLPERKTLLAVSQNVRKAASPVGMA